jgi:hypothetical protein
MFSGELAGALATGGAVFRRIGSGAAAATGGADSAGIGAAATGAVATGADSAGAGALAIGGCNGGDSDGIATGAGGALATGGCDGADSDGAGALASGGAELNGTVTGGADAAVGGSALGAGEVAPPGTPPVTLIESPVMSSVEDGRAAGAEASLALSERIEFPTVPSPIAGTADGADKGMLAPSLS